MFKLFENRSDCCGCSACKNICPHNAITLMADEEGFLYPVINEELCVECGLCKSVCAFQNNSEKISGVPSHVYAVKHKTDAVRMKSSSGGMFTAISDIVLENDGVVYGAVFNKNMHVCHQRAETIEYRDLQRGSKYLQSDMGNIFFDVKQDLESGREVLFTGTPCQIAGLKSYLVGIDITRLITVDLVCHGTSTPKLWEDYILFLEKRYESKINGYSFRSKEIGWRGYNVVVKFINGKSVQNAFDVLSFANLFSSDLALRPSCSNCKFASLDRVGDITIGDFWGIEKCLPEFDDNKGISLILVNSIKGGKVYKAIEKDLTSVESTVEDAIYRQPNLQQPSKPSRKSNQFWEEYKKYGFEYVCKKYTNFGLKCRAKNCIKRVISIYVNK